jgi:hypothetical protein
MKMRRQRLGDFEGAGNKLSYRPTVPRRDYSASQGLAYRCASPWTVTSHYDDEFRDVLIYHFAPISRSQNWFFVWFAFVTSMSSWTFLRNHFHGLDLCLLAPATACRCDSTAHCQALCGPQVSWGPAGWGRQMMAQSRRSYAVTHHLAVHAVEWMVVRLRHGTTRPHCTARSIPASKRSLHQTPRVG